MDQKIKGFSAFLMSLMLPSVALASGATEPTATFEDLSVTATLGHTPISSGDFSFVTNYNAPSFTSVFHGIKNESGKGSSNGTNYLVYLASGARTETFSLISGGAFDLTHIDIGGWFNSAPAPVITLTGFKAGPAGGTVSITLSLLGASFTTYTSDNGLAGFTVLQSVQLSGISNVSYVALDNINYVPATAPIPEPETYALMLGGLAVIGWAARRRVIKA